MKKKDIFQEVVVGNLCRFLLLRRGNNERGR
jgi:hypothetical protein